MKAENFLGQVGRLIRFITPTITVSTSAYASGDCIGGKLQLLNASRANGGVSNFVKVMIRDASNSAPQFNILVFDSDPTVATLTDNEPVVLSTDLSKVIAQIPIVTADYTTISTDDIAHKVLEDIIIKSAANSKTIYIALVATAAVTFSATTDLSLTSVIEQY